MSDQDRYRPPPTDADWQLWEREVVGEHIGDINWLALVAWVFGLWCVLVVFISAVIP